MSTVSPESSPGSPSGPALSLENLLLDSCLDYPESQGAVILRSQDSYEYHVPKIYLIHSSPILKQEILISPNSQGTSVISAELDVEGPKGTANAHRVVQLPVYNTTLTSLLSYIFPVQPILPSTTEQIMELLSVAQMYKMDVVLTNLTHIRNHIAQQQPPFIQKETAYLVYALAQKYGLCREALEAARCTLSFLTLVIQNLAEEDKLGLMSGASLHKFWKYHQIVRSSFTDIEQFKTSYLDVPEIDLGCVSLAGTGLPYWLKTYISNLGDTSVPVSLDFSSFNMEFVEHSRGLDTKYPEDWQDCEFCVSVSEEDIRALWEVLMAVVQGNVAKVSFTHVAAVVD